MSFFINTNVNAIDTERNLLMTSNALSTSMQRLSSGLRINSAADDAAGLAISQTITSQVNGMNQAQRNAQDGISMLQTAEGALNETQAMLQRMRQLAVESANDTYTSTDRQSIQEEVNQLAQEITRISNATSFNNQNLLDGNLTAAGNGNCVLQIGADAGQTVSFSIAAEDASTLGVAGTGTTPASVGTPTVTQTAGAASAITAGAAGGALTGWTGIHTVNVQIVTNGAGVNTVTASLDGGAYQADPNVTYNSGTKTLSVYGITSVLSATPGNNTTYQIGMGTFVQGGSAAAVYTGGVLTSQAATTVGLDMTTQTAASNAITTLDTAINTVSTQRANIGAYMNRLQHTINNLAVGSENLTAAQSRIQDVDVAAETVNMTKLNILQQAGISVLAQANQQPAAVLKLLQ